MARVVLLRTYGVWRVLVCDRDSPSQVPARSLNRGLMGRPSVRC